MRGKTETTGGKFSQKKNRKDGNKMKMKKKNEK